MKTLIIYTSQTGFTKRYADWIADRTGGDLLDLKDAQKKSDDYFEDYDAICYGGWAMAGSIVKVKWFLEKAVNWKDKRLAAFCVGGSPNDNPDVETFLQNALSEDQKKYIKGKWNRNELMEVIQEGTYTPQATRSTSTNKRPVRKGKAKR